MQITFQTYVLTPKETVRRNAGKTQSISVGTGGSHPGIWPRYFQIRSQKRCIISNLPVLRLRWIFIFAFVDSLRCIWYKPTRRFESCFCYRRQVFSYRCVTRCFIVLFQDNPGIVITAVTHYSKSLGFDLSWQVILKNWKKKKPG